MRPYKTPSFGVLITAIVAIFVGTIVFIPVGANKPEPTYYRVTLKMRIDNSSCSVNKTVIVQANSSSEAKRQAIREAQFETVITIGKTQKVQ